MNWNLILQAIIAIGVISFAVGQFFSGGKKVEVTNVDTANSTVDLFKKRADGLEEDLRKLRGEFEAYKKETSIKEEAYKKQISQQDQLLQTYSGILQNRNPELEAFIKLLTAVGNKADKFMDDARIFQEQQIKDTKEILKHHKI